MEKKSGLSTKLNICSILAAMILSMNGIRYLINIQESSTLVYGIYVMFISCAFVKYGRKINATFSKELGIFFLLGILTVFYALTTALLGGVDPIMDAVKLGVILVISYMVSLMSSEDIRYVLNSMYIIILIYVVAVLLNPSKIDAYLSKGSTYLNLSLPIGLILTMMLIRVILRLYNKNDRRKIILDSIVAVCCFVALTKFAGRGSIIFPIIIAGIFVLILGRKHFFKMIIIFALLLVTAVVAYRFFIRTADPYIVNRFLRLFNETSAEDRWGIWKGYIEYSIKHYWFIFGAGTGNSVKEYLYYPHNIYLHMAGEFGIIGIVTSLYYTFYILRTEVWGYFNISIKDNENSLLFYELCAGTLYLFFNFMKSFSLYDSCPLVMFIMLLATFVRNFRLERNDGSIFS